jgi:hypothetical protein
MYATIGTPTMHPRQNTIAKIMRTIGKTIDDFLEASDPLKDYTI